jgi:hypothetical protein
VSSVLVPPSLGLTVQLSDENVVLTQFNLISEPAAIELTRHECGVLYDFLHQLLAGDFDQEQGE